MTDEEILGRLGWFRAENRRREGEVRVSGNRALVTDGRIGFEAVLQEDRGKSGWDDFPESALRGYIDQAAQGAKWYSFTDEGVAALKKAVDDAKEERRKNAEYRRLDMTKCQCPCCGADLLWDGYHDELIEEDEYSEEKLEDVSTLLVPVELTAGEECMLANATYLFRAIYAFCDGNIGDVLFAICKKDNGRIAIRTRDGRVRGVLCCMRGDGEHLPAEIVLEPAEI